MVDSKVWNWHGSTVLTPYAKHAVSVSVCADGNRYCLNILVKATICGVDKVRTVFEMTEGASLPGMKADAVAAVIGQEMVQRLLQIKRPLLLLSRHDREWLEALHGILASLALHCICNNVRNTSTKSIPCAQRSLKS
jgi:hypothetical protein